MDTFVARQPIFTRQKEVHAYELLFRSSLENVFGDIDGDQASAKVLVDGVMGMGMPVLTGGKTAFVNFTQDDLPPRTSPPSKLDSEPFEVHSKG